MTPASKRDNSLLNEAYGHVKRVNEGMWDRAGANIAGAWQNAKNVGSAVKAGGQALTGNVAGAQQTLGNIQTGASAKESSILKSSAKNFMTDLFKLKIIPNLPPNTQPSDEDINTFITAIQPFVTQLKTGAASRASLTAKPQGATPPVAPISTTQPTQPQPVQTAP